MPILQQSTINQWSPHQVGVKHSALGDAFMAATLMSPYYYCVNGGQKSLPI